VLGFSTIAILPFDISASSQSESEDEKMMKNFWRFIYWTQFFLAYFIVPILMNYENSGEFNHRDRLRGAGKRVMYTYATYALLGGFFLSVLYVRGTFDGEQNGGFTF